MANAIVEGAPGFFDPRINKGFVEFCCSLGPPALDRKGLPVLSGMSVSFGEYLLRDYHKGLKVALCFKEKRVVSTSDRMQVTRMIARDGKILERWLDGVFELGLAEEDVDRFICDNKFHPALVLWHFREMGFESILTSVFSDFASATPFDARSAASAATAAASAANARSAASLFVNWIPDRTRIRNVKVGEDSFKFGFCLLFIKAYKSGNLSEVVDAASDDGLLRLVDAASDDGLLRLVDAASDDGLLRLVGAASKVEGGKARCIKAVKELYIKRGTESASKHAEAFVKLVAGTELGELPDGDVIPLVAAASENGLRRLVDAASKNGLRRLVDAASENGLRRLVDAASEKGLLRLVDATSEGNITKLLSAVQNSETGFTDKLNTIVRALSGDARREYALKSLTERLQKNLGVIKKACSSCEEFTINYRYEIDYMVKRAFDGVLRPGEVVNLSINGLWSSVTNSRGSINWENFQDSGADTLVFCGALSVLRSSAGGVEFMSIDELLCRSKSYYYE